MIHVFHGFLGSPSDFSFLKGDHILHHDLLGDLDSIRISSQDTLIGYSMGGRIALEMASRLNFNLKKLVLINAHAGFTNEAEKAVRRSWEDEIEKKILENDFLSYWNSLSIFSADKPLPEIAPERLRSFKDLFYRFRLSQQKNFFPEIDKHKDKTLWIIGEQDKKYSSWAKMELLPREIPFRLTAGGHRLFQHPEGLLHVLNEEGIL